MYLNGSRHCPRCPEAFLSGIFFRNGKSIRVYLELYSSREDLV